MGGETGMINAEISSNYRETKLGVGFNYSLGYQLPNGANRSPSCSWIPIEKWNNLTPKQREKFLPFCPDFLVELMSPCDSLSDTREKMKEYLENGMKLGWLINLKSRLVEIYRADKEVEILDSPDRLLTDYLEKMFYRKINVYSLSIHGEKSGRGMARSPRHIHETKRRKKFLLTQSSP
ncbi:MAG: Uma2 family endonuclease [Okeania sp. SIO2D1]|nr:Uma2 family endonuclease [Okeania sp. SIO2D1]